MRVGIASGFACSLSWAARLQDEGHEVRLWIDRGHPASATLSHVGDGLVTKEPDYARLVEWCDQGDALLLFDASGMGEKADAARARGIPVIGGGSFMDRLEKDRLFGARIAEEAGCPLPDSMDFASLSECQAYAEHLDRPVYFKTDAYINADATHKCKDGEDLRDYLDYLKTQARDTTRCMIQECIEGVALSTARWWNGATFVGPYEGTLEHKALMNDDVGPSTGCSFNATWFYSDEEPDIARLLSWENLQSAFRKYHAAPGLYDINAVVSDDDGQAYFLEWTPRMGYDSEPTSMRLIDDLGDWLWSVALGIGDSAFSDDLGYSVRLTVPPYPWEYASSGDKKTCVGVPIFGADGLWEEQFIAYQVQQGEYALEVASPEGIVGLAYAQGTDLEALGEQALEYAKSLRVPGLQYRTDGHICIAKDAKRLRAAGITLPGGLTS